MKITLDYILEKYKHRTFYLYHILGKKWGCTLDIEKRLRDQNFTKNDCVEIKEVIGIQVADRLEKFLNERDGYPYSHTQSYIVALIKQLKRNKNRKRKPSGIVTKGFSGKNHSNRSKLKTSRTVKRLYKEGKIKPTRHSGEKNGMAKYTAEQARFVKQHYFKQKNQYDIPPKGKLTVRQIMDEINVSYRFVRRVSTDGGWKHIT